MTLNEIGPVLPVVIFEVLAKGESQMGVFFGGIRRRRLFQMLLGNLNVQGEEGCVLGGFCRLLQGT